MRVLKAEPIKAAFKPYRIVRAQARGQVYDPHKIVGMEVTLVADSAMELTSRAAFDMARDEAKFHAPSAVFVRVKSNPYPYGLNGEGKVREYLRTFIVDS